MIQANHYADQLVDVINRNFPDYQQKLTRETLLEGKKNLDDGQVVDLSQRRNKTSVALLQWEEIVWFGIGVREAFIQNNTTIPTHRGFFSHVAVDTPYRGKNSLFLLMSIVELLFKSWVSQIIWSTSVLNHHADTLYAKIAKEKILTDDGLRYKYSYDTHCFESWRKLIASIPKYQQAITALLSS